MAVVHIQIFWLTNWYGRAKRYAAHSKTVKLLLASLVWPGKRYKHSENNQLSCIYLKIVTWRAPLCTTTTTITPSVE